MKIMNLYLHEARKIANFCDERNLARGGRVRKQYINSLLMSACIEFSMSVQLKVARVTVNGNCN